MPYENVPADKQDEMERCVQQVMGDGKDEQSAIAICYTSIVGKSVAAEKIGERNSGTDAERLQSIHDLAVANGATCQAEARKEYDFVCIGDDVKALGNGVVGGYIVRYSSADDLDATGEYFDATTAIKSPKELPVIYQHGRDPKLQDRELGIGAIKTDDVGVWIEAQLNMRDEYEKAIYEMARQGKLGWSSGALSHLVKREQVGNATHIKSWWIGEASLTPTPAEIRNSAMPLKALLEIQNKKGKEKMSTKEEKAAYTVNGSLNIYPELEAPETPEEEAAEGEQVAASAPEGEMAKSIAQAVAAEFARRDKAARVKAESAARIKTAEQAGYQKALAEFSEKYGVPAFNKSTTLCFSEDKDAVPAFKHWLKTGQENGGLLRPDASYSAIKAAFNQTTGASGGFLLPDPLYDRVIAKRNLQSWVRQMPVQKFQTESDHLLVPVEDTSATAFVLTSEAGAYDENEPTVAQKDLILYKYTKLIKASEEFLMNQGTNFDEWITDVLGRAEAQTENTIFTTGSGSGAPQGVITGATTANTTATTDVILPSELIGLFGYLNSGYNVQSECGLLMNNQTKWYLAGQTSNPFLYLQTPAASGGTPMEQLLGYKVVVDDDVVTYTTALAKCVLFGNFNYYGVVEKSGMIVQRNPYLYMGNGQIGIFANIYRGGGVLQSEAFYYLTNHA